MNQLEKDNNLQEGQIEIKACPDIKNMVKIAIVAKKITIDWGDGTVENSIPNNKLSIRRGNGIIDEIDGQCFTHEYPNQDLKAIKIDTEEMTMFEYLGNHSHCHSSQELRFGNCQYLTHIMCHYYKISVLDISKCNALTYIDCSSNQLTSLDVSKCTNLTQLLCEGNKLTSLEVSGCPALIDLACDENQITSLDISNCTNLAQLFCNNNQLTHLDISKCTDLSKLNCCSNKLTSLDVSSCTVLKELECSGNLLSSLNISKCIALTELNCSDNQLSATAINFIFMGLPQVRASITCHNNSGFETCDKSILIMKGWKEDIYKSPFLFFKTIHGDGTIKCCDCGHSEDITSECYFHGLQCQSCGKFYDLRERYTIKCECGRLLDRDKPLFCPKCKSKNMKFECDNKYECDDLP